MNARIALAAGSILLIVVIAGTAVRAASGAAPATPSTVPMGTATVVRTTITSRQQVTGTLGYGTPTTVVAPLGTTPQQVQQAQASYDAALVALRAAQNAAGDGSPTSNARASLDAALTSYASDRSAASAAIAEATEDLAAYPHRIDALRAQIRAARDDMQIYQWRSEVGAAITSLNAADAAVTRALGIWNDLMRGDVALYQRGGSEISAATAAFDAAFDAGGDTRSAATAFAAARSDLATAAAHLSSELDTAGAATSEAAAATVSAYAPFNGVNTRTYPEFQQWRTALGDIVTAAAREAPLVAAMRTAIARGTAHVDALAGPIASGLRGAAAAVDSAAQQTATADAQHTSALASAGQSASNAHAQLTVAQDAEALPAGTFTWLPALGATITPGTPLYAVDGRPVILVTGTAPMYRHIALGATGTDVSQLEDALGALGYDTTRDGTFEETDADAFRALQRALGIAPTGEVALGAVVFLPGPVRVAALHGAVGSAYGPGQPIIDVTETAHVVTVALDTTLQTNVHVGDVVSVTIPGRAQAASGKVALVSGVAQTPSNSNQGQQGLVRANVQVTIRLDDPTAGGSLDQAPVRVSITDQVRANVLAVPVTSLVAKADGSYIVRVVRGADRVDVSVVPGVFGDNGLVEVTGALSAGDAVEIPKPL